MKLQQLRRRIEALEQRNTKVLLVEQDPDGGLTMDGEPVTEEDIERILQQPWIRIIRIIEEDQPY